MVTQVDLSVRPAAGDDLAKLANLIHFEIYVHRHLDWRPPLDWIGYQPYLLAEDGRSVVASLACPPDPPGVAWIRLFAVASSTPLRTAWQALWPRAVQQLSEMEGPVEWVAAIPLQNWFQLILKESGFEELHRVVMLHWDRGGKSRPKEKNGMTTIRPMNFDDLEKVAEIDSLAFIPVWQNSQPCLELAFRQAAVATVAEQDGQIVGYQISTATSLGGHLARLAVRPGFQGKGVGYELVDDLLNQFERRGAQTVTVNTQHNNDASLSLYKKTGFRLTGEEYPIYQFLIKS